MRGGNRKGDGLALMVLLAGVFAVLAPLFAWGLVCAFIYAACFSRRVSGWVCRKSSVG